MTQLYTTSALLGLITTLVATGLGWCGALAWLGSNTWGRRALLAAAMACWLMPPFLVANTWLEWSQGWLAGASRGPIQGVLLVSILLAFMFWPVVFGLLILAWKPIRSDYLEVEPRMTGFAVCRHLLLPAARPVLPLAAIVVLALAVTDFSLPTLFQVRVFTEEFWLRFNTQLDAKGALISVWPLGLLLFVPAWIARKRSQLHQGHNRSKGWAWAWAWVTIFSERRGVEMEHGFRPGRGSGSEGSDHLWRMRLGWTRVLSVIVICGTLALAVGLPLSRLLVESRTWTDLPDAWTAGQLALWNSLCAAVLASTCASVLGWVLAGVGGRIRRGPVWAWGLFLMPGIVAGVGWIWLLNRPATHSIYTGFSIVILALTAHYIALAWGIAAETLRAGNRSLLEQAKLMAADPWQTVRWVEWPQARMGFLVGWYVVYLLCLWDVESIVLLIPPGGETLALRIFNLLHYGHAGHVHALTLALLLLGLLPGLLFVLVKFTGNVAGPFITRLFLRFQCEYKAVPLFSVLFVAMGLTSGCRGKTDDGVASLDSIVFAEARVIGSRGVAPGQFNKPRSLICDRNGNLYVSDLTGRIQKFSSEGEPLLQWHVEQIDLGKPKGMGVDPAGNILVIEPHYMRVNHYSQDGQLLATWGQRGREPGRFVLPRGIAVNSKGEYFLSEYTVVDRIQHFAPFLPDHLPALNTNVATRPGPAFLNTWGEPGHGPSEFGRAESLCVGPDDTLYVADSCNHRIQVFRQDGTFLRAHGQAGSAPGRLSYPYDIRVDSDGYQYVCEFGNSRISIFDPQDEWVESIGGPGGRPGEFANPWSIAFDHEGNLYVADSQNHRVQKLIRRKNWKSRLNDREKS
jgi:ABC-type Fe3+ transport system permease subunit/sugar lactone lactonase YvrE